MTFYYYRGGNLLGGEQNWNVRGDDAHAENVNYCSANTAARGTRGRALISYAFNWNKSTRTIASDSPEVDEAAHNTELRRWCCWPDEGVDLLRGEDLALPRSGPSSGATRRRQRPLGRVLRALLGNWLHRLRLKPGHRKTAVELKPTTIRTWDASSGVARSSALRRVLKQLINVLGPLTSTASTTRHVQWAPPEEEKRSEERCVGCHSPPNGQAENHRRSTRKLDLHMKRVYSGMFGWRGRK